MSAFVFTFPIGDELRRDSYLVVAADDEVVARQLVIHRYGRAFGSCYRADDPATDEMIERYGLTEIAFGT